jgi:hypothetical protein
MMWYTFISARNIQNSEFAKNACTFVFRHTFHLSGFLYYSLSIYASVFHAVSSLYIYGLKFCLNFC